MLVAGELDRPREEFDRLVHLVPTPRELAGTAKPVHGPCTQPLELGGIVDPDEIDILGLDCLGVVVREERGVLVLAQVTGFQPVGEHRVEPAAPGLRNAGVGDLTRERVLDRVLAVARDHRPSVAPDEIALLEEVEVRLLTGQEVNDGRRPEHPPDDGSGLQRRLLGGRQPVDAGREHRVHGVGHREVELVRAERPLAVPLLEHTGIDELPDELLEEERVAFGSVDHELAELGREDGGKHLVEHARRLLCRKRVEPHSGGVSLAGSPGGPAILELWSRGRKHHDRSPHIGHDPLEQVEEVVLGPVDVLDQHDGGSLRRKLVHEGDHCLVQSLPCVERMELTRDVEAEGKAEDLAPLELP